MTCFATFNVWLFMQGFKQVFKTCDVNLEDSRRRRVTSSCFCWLLQAFESELSQRQSLGAGAKKRSHRRRLKESDHVSAESDFESVENLSLSTLPCVALTLRSGHGLRLAINGYRVHFSPIELWCTIPVKPLTLTLLSASSIVWYHRYRGRGKQAHHAMYWPPVQGAAASTGSWRIGDQRRTVRCWLQKEWVSE